jgi:hypothetical protein
MVGKTTLSVDSVEPGALRVRNPIRARVLTLNEWAPLATDAREDRWDKEQPYDFDAIVTQVAAVPIQLGVSRQVDTRDSHVTFEFGARGPCSQPMTVLLTTFRSSRGTRVPLLHSTFASICVDPSW